MATHNARKQLYLAKGTITAEFPEQWLDRFDHRTCYAKTANRHRIKLSPNRAFELWTEQRRPTLISRARALTPQEINDTPWGPPGPAWESPTTAQLFGHSQPLHLDWLLTPDGSLDTTTTL